MNLKRYAKIISWTPRVLAIALCIMTLALGLDVFDMKSSWMRMMIGFLIQGIPAYLLMGNTVISWKKPLAGGSIFIGIGIAYLIISKGRFLTVAMFPVVVGALFILQYYLLDYKK